MEYMQGNREMSRTIRRMRAQMEWERKIYRRVLLAIVASFLILALGFLVYSTKSKAAETKVNETRTKKKYYTSVMLRPGMDNEEVILDQYMDTEIYNIDEYLEEIREINKLPAYVDFWDMLNPGDSIIVPYYR